MEERMKAIEQKNDGYGTFCKNILKAAYRKSGRNLSKYSRLMIMDQDKAFLAQCLPELKGSRALRDNKYLVKKNELQNVHSEYSNSGSSLYSR
jgi:hypothetical protein